MLQAFLQRIVNGGGRVSREYALGRKYTDLLLEWPLDEVKGFYGEVQRVVFELKILRGGLDKTMEDSGMPAAVLLENMNLMREGTFNLAGALLFTRQPEFHLPNCIIKAVAFPRNRYKYDDLPR